MSDLWIYFVSPANILVYSLNCLGQTFLYNAGSLGRIDSPEIKSFKKVKGVVTDHFGVKPVVLGYSNGELEIVYAPGKSKGVIRSNGSLIPSEQNKVVAKADILVPDLEQADLTETLPELFLQDSDEESLTNFIKLSREGKPQIIEPESPLNIETRLNELERLIEALNRQLYQIRPVKCPSELRINGVLTPLIDVSEAKKKLENKEIENFNLEPLLQPYAGSHRSNNRMITLYGKDGKTYLSRVSYDAKTNGISSPK